MKAITDAMKPHLGGNVPGGDKRTYYPGLWDWLVMKYNVKKVLDVGCGEGHALEYFKNALKCDVLGIDGLQRNVECVQRKNIDGVVNDLSIGSFHINKVIDLVWCCELVEHVEEKYLSNVLNTLYNGKVVAMTHALPEQRGWHHVNCQDDLYWINALASVGFTYLKDDTAHARSLAKYYFLQSGLIFQRV